MMKRHWFFLITVFMCQSASSSVDLMHPITWYQMSKADIRLRGDDLIKELTSLIGTEPEATRRALIRYMDGIPPRDLPWSNIYIFNRLYFKVPDELLVKEQCYVAWEHGGRLDGIKGDEDRVSGVYPLVRVAGKLRLGGFFYSWRSSKPYPVMEEFECFLKKYELRDKIEYGY